MMQELFQVWNITLPLLPPELKLFTRLWRMPPFTALIERSFAKLVPWSPAHGQGEEDHALSMGQKSVSLFQWLLLNHSPKRGKKRNWKQTWQNSRNLPPPAPQTHTQMKAHIVYMGWGGEDQKPLDAKRRLSCTGLGLATTSWAPLGTFLLCSMFLISSICSAALGICVSSTFWFFFCCQ